MEMRPEIFFSALSGSGIGIILAKYALNKALRDLERVSDKVMEIDKRLAVILVRLEKLIEHERSIKDLQKKLAR